MPPLPEVNQGEGGRRQKKMKILQIKLGRARAARDTTYETTGAKEVDIKKAIEINYERKTTTRNVSKNTTI